MELVRGMPITEYCDQQQLSIRERLVPRLAKSDELVLHPTSHRFKRTRRLSLDF